VLRLVGEHDLLTRERTEAALESALGDNRLVVVDLRETEFIDSSVLNSLSRAKRNAEQAGKQLRLLVATSAVVSAALRITKLDDEIGCVATLEEALQE
jgi:anti-anti-sigma factor